MLIYIQLLSWMEFIRIKLIELYNHYHDRHSELLQYSSSEQKYRSRKEEVICYLKEKINEAIMSMIVLIAKSCKKEDRENSEEAVVLTAVEMAVLCKCKENLQRIRYNLLNLCVDNYLDNQRILAEMYQSCRNSYTFQGESKGIRVKVRLMDNCQNHIYQQQQQRYQAKLVDENLKGKGDYSIFNPQILTKHQKKDSVSNNRLHYPYYNAQQTLVSKIYNDKSDETINKSENQSSIMMKGRKKKFNYIEDFQVQQQKMRQMSKNARLKYTF